METPSSLTYFCRVCLELPDESELLDCNLIYDEDEHLSYAECFAICTQTELKNGEGVPHNLCKSCGLELQMAYDFFKKVENSRRIIERMHQSCEEASHGKPEEKEVSQTTESEMFEERLESDEIEEHIQLEECPAIEEDISSDEMEPIQINVATKSDVEECGTETLAIDIQVNQVETTDVTSETNSWKHAVVTVANESHLPLTTSDEELSTATTTNVAQIANTSKKSDERSRRHMGISSCDYCGKVFPNFSRMKHHRRSHEVDRLKYPCSNCERIYATKQAMEVHVRTVHQKTGYACSVCNKIYAIRKSLEVHMRYHTGDFPYVCDLCGRKFAQMCHLNTHKNVKHNSARFCCDYPNCGKFFTSSSSLRNHEFSHSDMPFECEYCQQGYPAKSKLKVHIRRKHDKELTLDELEHMRKFHVLRSKLNLVRIADCED